MYLARHLDLTDTLVLEDAKNHTGFLWKSWKGKLGENDFMKIIRITWKFMVRQKRPFTLLLAKKKGIWTYSSEKKVVHCMFFKDIYTHIHTSKIKHAQAVNLAVNWIAMLVT